MRTPFRIGVTGHRDLGDEVTAAFVARQCKAVLQKALTEHGEVVALSALAEGADTLFAEAALELGIPLEAVTPFEGYVEDFKGQARERYERLLAQTRVEHRLPHAERSDEAYLAGGLWVVNHCDFLVVIWNGQPAAGTGGTGDVVDYAQQVGRPYIHIHTVERTVTPSFQGGQTMDKFKEYKFFAQNTWDLSSRRIATTSTYLTVNTAIFAIIAFLVKDVKFSGWWLVLAATPIFAVGVILCGVWWEIIERHRRLIGWRFDQLMEMEEQITGSHRMYLREWKEFYGPNQKPLEGQKGKKFEFTQLEKRMPQLFMVLYIIFWLGLIIAAALGWR
jgi:hypothetical protein